MTQKSFKSFDKLVKKGLLIDRGIHNFLKPVFSKYQDRIQFITKCLKKTTSRRMLNHAHWYIEIADAQEKVKSGRSALKIIFLMSLAEYIAKEMKGKHLGSEEAIQMFFKGSSTDDKKELKKGIKRLLAKHPHHSLRFRSIVNILYNVRNKAVHGEDYYSFSLPDPKYKETHLNYNHWGVITSGYLAVRHRKTKKGAKNKAKKKTIISLDISITYEELREIFRRTAIKNIESMI